MADPVEQWLPWQQTLKVIVSLGYADVYWQSRDTLRKVTTVGKHHDEPGPVAYLGNGEYVALDNAMPADFHVGRLISFKTMIATAKAEIDALMEKEKQCQDPAVEPPSSVPS